MEEDNLAVNEEIDLKELFQVLWAGKKIIILITVIAAVLSVVYALSLTNVYRSTAILSPVNSSDESMRQISSSKVADLSNLTGIQLPKKVDNTKLGIEVMKSRKFFNEFVQNENVLVTLMASIGWNASHNELKINKDLYDVDKRLWLYKDGSPPSLQTSHRKFLSLFSVSEDQRSFFIELSMDHYSPYVAKEWLDKIIIQTNNTIRYKDIENAELAIKYLEEEISNTSSAELESGLYNLVQTHAEKKVLARATPEYVFEVIDPPHIPEMKIKPRRSVICILGTILGCMLSLVLVLTRHYFFKPHQIKIS